MKPSVAALCVWVLAVLSLAACGQVAAGDDSGSLFDDDLGFVSKLDVKTNDTAGPGADGKGDTSLVDATTDSDAGVAQQDAADGNADGAADAPGPGDAVELEDAATPEDDVTPEDDATLQDDAVTDQDDATTPKDAATGDAGATDGGSTDGGSSDAAADTGPVTGPAALCWPCATDSDCQAQDPAAVCIQYGTTGAFCGSACTVSNDCPKGYICADAEGSGGPAATKQCLHTQGECPCSASAIAAAASTPCTKKNGIGTCSGKRTCTNAGLSTCDAPAASVETCDGVDNDCDGQTDPADAAGCTSYYLDQDGDGYGAGKAQCLCASSAGSWVTAGGDCNDNDAAIHPKAQEVCGNGIDDNCNGQQDEGAAQGCSAWFTDVDGDGFGVGASVCLCQADLTHTANQGGDCNDNAASVYPGATESCNGLDDDCNGATDDGPPADCTLFYADADKDGVGGGAGVCLCQADAGHPLKTGGDCDDSNPAIHPGVTESCNGQDDNCNGATDELGATGCSNFHVDADGDGFGGKDVKCACAADPVYNTLNSTDCDDSHASVHPGAVEVCDGLDNNCDGVTDPANLDTCTNYFADADSDGWGTLQAAIKCLCAPSGQWAATQPGDCNDSDPAIHPGATELCNQKDDNCDGETDNNAGTVYYADGDGDSYGNAKVTLTSCTPVPTFVTNALDCNDGNAAIKPGAVEICDGSDNNCNGATDEGLCDDGSVCTTDACVPGSGCTHTPANSGACDDGNACTVNDTCTAGVCKGTGSNCDDGNACTSDSCAGLGCNHYNLAGACNDGNACTSNDACSAGTCKGTTLNCDDGNICTTDACDPVQGCSHTNTCPGLPFADPGNTYAEGLSKTGKLIAWGNAATVPAGTFVQVSAGYAFACAVNASGNMTCWGASTPSALLSTQTSIQQVSVGKPHACVTKTDGTLKCWNSSGTAQTTGTPTGTFVQVACGYDHSCALRADGTVACWGGSNSYKQNTVPAGETFSQITAGNYFSCGIRKSGAGIVCWGSDASYAVSSAPKTGSFLAIAAGSEACAIAADHTMKCWTTTGFGSSTPPAGTTWQSLGAGENNVCGVHLDGSVECFGDDTNNVVTGVPLTGW